MYEHDFTNPYLHYLPEQLQDFITELICQEQDCVLHGLEEQLDTVRQHRVDATDALLKMSGVWA